MTIGIDVATSRLHVAEVVGKDASGLRLARPIDVKASVPTAIYLEAVRRMLAEETISDVVYLEDPWIRGDDQASVRSILKQHRAIYLVEAAAALAGKTVRYVAVPTWKAAVFAQGRQSTKQAKDFSMWYVKTVYGLDVHGDDNLADAICIATYGYGAESPRWKEALATKKNGGR